MEMLNTKEVLSKANNITPYNAILLEIIEEIKKFSMI